MINSNLNSSWEWVEGVSGGSNTHQTFSIADRSFINSDGKNNMPSGEIYTGPIEKSANGWIKFIYPAIKDGWEVDGVELEFKDGRVVEARAKKMWTSWSVRSIPMMEFDTLVSLPSAPTAVSNVLQKVSCTMKRSLAVSTWQSAMVIRKQAASINHVSIGTLSAICEMIAKYWWMGNFFIKTVNLWYSYN